MKNRYLIITILILIPGLGSAQNYERFSSEEIKVKLTEEAEAESELTVNRAVKTHLQNNKAYGDTLYYQDFANQIPSGWSVINQAGNSNNWIWSNTAPGGQYSSNVTSINSTTASNGFMSLPAEIYITLPSLPEDLALWILGLTLP